MYKFKRFEYFIFLLYRVSMNFIESFFGVKVLLDVSDFEMKKYCDCLIEI